MDTGLGTPDDESSDFQSSQAYETIEPLETMWWFKTMWWLNEMFYWAKSYTSLCSFCKTSILDENADGLMNYHCGSSLKFLDVGLSSSMWGPATTHVLPILGPLVLTWKRSSLVLNFSCFKMIIWFGVEIVGLTSTTTFITYHENMWINLKLI